MPVLRRPSRDRWAPDAGYDDDHVLGYEDDIIAYEDDDITVILEWLFGPPSEETRRYEILSGEIQKSQKSWGSSLGGGIMRRVELYQRNSLLLKITVRDEKGNAVDLTGSQVFFTIRKRGENPSVVKSVGEGVVIINPVEGEIEVDIDGEETNLLLGDYGMELLIIDQVGHRYTANQGVLRVLPSLFHDQEGE